MSRDRKQNIEFGRVSQEYLASPGGGAEPSDLFQASRRRPGAGLRPTPARQAVELSVVLTITTARRFGPLSSVRFIGFHSPHQLCQFLREGRRNNVVECPPQVAPERQRELHWIERCGRPTTHGHTSPREAFPAPIVLERTWRGRVPFPTSATGFSRPRRTKSATSCSASTPSANQGVRTAGPLYTVGVVDRTISAVAPLAGMESGYRISSNRCKSEIVESNRFSGHRWRAV